MKLENIGIVLTMEELRKIKAGNAKSEQCLPGQEVQ